ncbi:hypothetical protein ARALYDRAFT_483607 [Arabidopsis lyrata subsp. lyrata]|uniref:Phytocyanin domain-containing protein n=1 Tax=Arabidopsis lyrata subsp. lyrata TaxID=81972 RepID=D7LBS1_ARALL|nr:hypothetical protein ARALYDRAFT_483607 [Arabidopsis lyrata subsp. lyrata]
MAMNGLSKMAAAAATALLLVLTIVPATVAVTYTVGDGQQWDSGVDYTVWVAGKTFRVGDILETSSSMVDHTRWMRLTKPDMMAATPPPRLRTIPKLAATVLAASAGPPATPTPPSSTPGTPTPPSTTPGTPTTPDSPPAGGSPTTPTPDSGSTSPPPPKPSGASKGVMSYVLVGVSMVLGYALWM